MAKLDLIFDNGGFTDDIFGVEWPNGVPRLQAFLGTDPGHVRSLNTNFIMSNTPPGHKIYFFAGSSLALEQRNMKEDLTSLGVPFEERTITIGEVDVGLIRRRRVQKKGYFVLASTNRKDVVDSVFECYKVAWFGEGWSFVFLVARSEPPGWKDLIDILFKRQAIPSKLVPFTHCILKTRHENGISIASSEITPKDLTRIAANLAAELSLELIVRNLP